MIDQYRYIPLEIDDFRALSMWKYKPTSVIILVSSTYERRALPHKFTRQVSIYAHKSSESLLPPFFIYPQRPSPLLGHSPSGLILTRPDSLALAGVFTGVEGLSGDHSWLLVWGRWTSTSVVLTKKVILSRPISRRGVQ